MKPFVKKGAYISGRPSNKKKNVRRKIVETKEDREIVQLFIERDEQAITCVKEKYGARIRRLAEDITEDYQASEECENDTYLAAWNSIPPHEPYEYLYPFLVRLTRNIALNLCRKNNALKRKASVVELSKELEEVLMGECADDWFKEEEIKEILNCFLKSCKEEHRNIFVRRYWYLDSVATIANGYGITEGKVKSSLFRSRRKLQRMLRKEGYSI